MSIRTLRIPESECLVTFARSGGAGGQNVNKVSTKVTLSWDFRISGRLNDSEKRRIQASSALGSRINRDGLIVLHEQRARTQGENRALALMKLNELLAEALKVQRRRVKTRVGYGQKQKRMQEKNARRQRISQRRITE